MITRSTARRRRRSYVLRSDCQEQRTCVMDRTMPYPVRSINHQKRSPSRLENCNQCDREDLAVSPQSQVSNISVDSAYFTSPESHACESPVDICTMRTRSATWLSSLRSVLQRPSTVSTQIDDLQPADGTLMSEAELDRFLFETWINEATLSPRITGSPVSNYIKKISELKTIFELKMTEIAQKEGVYLRQLLEMYNLKHSELRNTIELRRTLLHTKVNSKFSQLRVKVKQELVHTIVQLRAQYISDSGHRRRSFRPKTTKILCEWYEQHINHPYPTEIEKKFLSTQCGITMEQVTTWFNNKRCRRKSISHKGRGSTQL